MKKIRVFYQKIFIFFFFFFFFFFALKFSFEWACFRNAWRKRELQTGFYCVCL